MTDRQIINKFFDRIKADIKQEQIAKNIRASGESADNLRGEIEESTNETIGFLFGVSYFDQQQQGSPKGTHVPFGKLYQWSIHKDIVPKGKQPRGAMVKAMQRKIFREGTDIYQKKRQGLDLKGIINRNLKDVIVEVKTSKTVEFASDLVKMFNN